MQKKKKNITTLLKYVADLLGQINSLKDENERLSRKNEMLLQEIEKYKGISAPEESFGENDQSFIEKKKPVRKYNTATALYIDIQGNRHMTEALDSHVLVDSLDEIHIKLQEIISRYDIKEIKTVGDSMICVGGIPRKNLANPVQVLLAAIEMQYVIKNLQQSGSNNGIWKARMGIHTGTITASISNIKKQQYNVQGATVDLATRIRHLCLENQILISASTYELVKEFFICNYFDTIPIKYHGDIQLFEVKGIKDYFSMKGRQIIPNKSMNIRIGLLQFTDLQELVLDKMEKELPSALYYHNVKHTVDVVTQVELIGFGENVSDEELLLLKTAALFHDIGHVISYDCHEYFSTLIARETLAEFNYTQTQIESICELIMATKLPPKPMNKLEEIICDADLDYLGRSDMIPVSNTLYLEMKERKMVNSLEDWNNKQIEFISGHQYFTETARNLREVNKQMQIARIKHLIN